MELIYFIIGFITTTVAYGIVLLHKTKRSHSLLLKDLTKNQEDSTTQNALREEEILYMLQHYKEIKESMEADAYKSNTELSNSITKLSELIHNKDEGNGKLFDTADIQFKNMWAEIQTIRNNMQRFELDPDVIKRF